jgi:hypothetical protein
VRNAVKLTICLALLATPSVALAAGSAGSARVLAINCDRDQYKPRKVVLACADAGIWLSHLRWSSWNRARARASGTYNENLCQPDCADGRVVAAPVKVTLSRPRSCPGRAHRAFGLATFTYPDKPPPHAYHRYQFICPP